MSKKTNKFSPEVRTRAVRMVLEHGVVYPSRWAAVVTLPPTSIQRDVDSGGCHGRSGLGKRRGLPRSPQSSAAAGPVGG